MKLIVNPAGARALIRGYAAGSVRIGEQTFGHAVFVGGPSTVSELRPQHPADLTEADLASVFALQPALVLIGWAGGQTFMPAAQRRWFLERGIGLEVMELGAACRTYNVLVGDERRVVALLFPV